MNRRTFLAATAATAAVGSAAADTARLPIKKGILLGMLPKTLSFTERFQLAREVGFEAVECEARMDQHEAEQIKKAADAARIPIHSVMCMSHWGHPLSSADPAVVAECVKGVDASLQNAQIYGASTVLLVPAVVNPETSYKDAWVRSQREIRKLIPMAEKRKVVIAVEEVWNKFLLSPLEFAQYVDEFKSPWVKAYFDVGNIVFYGYPQDWIRTLGKRIAKLHLKDFKFEKGQTTWTPLREGQIDWKAVYAALASIGYHGVATVELPGGNADYLREVSHRVDLILNNA
jgi:L-ribulose-5-phosphate 3-epimerase